MTSPVSARKVVRPRWWWQGRGVMGGMEWGEQNMLPCVKVLPVTPLFITLLLAHCVHHCFAFFIEIKPI